MSERVFFDADGVGALCARDMVGGLRAVADAVEAGQLEGRMLYSEGVGGGKDDDRVHVRLSLDLAPTGKLLPESSQSEVVHRAEEDVQAQGAVVSEVPSTPSTGMYKAWPMRANAPTALCEEDGEDAVSEELAVLVANLRNATEEELQAQRESFAKSYMPGPRHARAWPESTLTLRDEGLGER